MITYLREVYGNSICIISIEPSTAAVLYISLKNKKNTEIKCEETVCAGLDCGVLNPIAWPLL